jgi:hypothetical protein
MLVHAGAIGGFALDPSILYRVSLVAQTGLRFDLRSAQGKLIASLTAAIAEFERDHSKSGSDRVSLPRKSVGSFSVGEPVIASRQTASR